VTILTLGEAQARLSEVVHRLTPGEEVVITDNNEPVATLIGKPTKPAKPSRPGPGLCKGLITFMAADFDAPLEDMKDYTAWFPRPEDRV
jgi:prevent-host-death family protein